MTPLGVEHVRISGIVRPRFGLNLAMTPLGVEHVNSQVMVGVRLVLNLAMTPLGVERTPAGHLGLPGFSDGAVALRHVSLRPELGHGHEAGVLGTSRAWKVRSRSKELCAWARCRWVKCR
jgi:hypothetical protein